MESSLQDIRYGVRSLLKRPAFTAVALIILALGIGANTAIFSVVDAVLLRPLPFRDADRLVKIVESDPQRGNRLLISLGDFAEWRNQSQSFEGMAAFAHVSFRIANSNFVLTDRWGGQEIEIQLTPVRISEIRNPKSEIRNGK